MCIDPNKMINSHRSRREFHFDGVKFVRKSAAFQLPKKRFAPRIPTTPISISHRREGKRPFRRCACHAVLCLFVKKWNICIPATSSPSLWTIYVPFLTSAHHTKDQTQLHHITINLNWISQSHLLRPMEGNSLSTFFLFCFMLSSVGVFAHTTYPMSNIGTQMLCNSIVSLSNVC